MKKTLIILVFLSVSFISRFSFAEIVTLDDGRIINLNEDGTFTIISENVDNTNSSYQNSIIFLLDLLSINYQSIDFLSDSKIVLENITIEDEIKIDQLTLIGLNKKYFLNFNLKKFDSYKGKLFKKLIIENLSTEQDSGDQVSIDLLEINELDIKKIDLLKRLIEGKSISNAENILSVIDSFSVDKIILKKFKSKYAQTYVSLDNFVINNFRNSSVGGLFYTGLDFDDYTQLIKVDKFEINNLIFNRPSTYNIDWNEFAYLNDPRDLFLFFNSVRRISTIGYYHESKSNQFIIKIDESEVTDFKTKKIDGFSIPVSYKARTKGMQISSTDNFFKNELKKLNYDELKFNAELILNWNTIYNIFSIDFIIGMQSGFDLSLDVKIEDVNESLINLVGSPDLMDSLMKDPKIKKFEISLHDKGLTNKLLNYGATNYDMTKSEFIDFMIDEMQSNIMIDNSLKNDFMITITNFIQQPNMITFSINPLTSLSYADISSLIGSPDILVKLLNIKIQ